MSPEALDKLVEERALALHNREVYENGYYKGVLVGVDNALHVLAQYGLIDIDAVRNASRKLRTEWQRAGMVRVRAAEAA